jgi:RNA recognition motif-containing protein
VQIHVGNLARDVGEAELRLAFEPFGQVVAVRIVTDRNNNISRGFGFVDMPDRAEALAAIEGLNMKELVGRTLDVSESLGHRDGRRDNRSRGGRGHGRPGSKNKGGGSSGGKRRRF